MHLLGNKSDTNPLRFWKVMNISAVEKLWISSFKSKVRINFWSSQLSKGTFQLFSNRVWTQNSELSFSYEHGTLMFCCFLLRVRANASINSSQSIQLQPNPSEFISIHPNSSQSIFKFNRIEFGWIMSRGRHTAIVSILVSVDFYSENLK